MSMRKLRRIGSRVLTVALICSMSLFSFPANAAEMHMPAFNTKNVEGSNLAEDSMVTEGGLLKENSENTGNEDRGLKEETEDKGTIFDENSEEADDGSENEDKGLDKNIEDKDTAENKDILED